MKFTTILATLGAAASTLATTVSYDTGYDNAARSMTAVSCSDGANGLITRTSSLALTPPLTTSFPTSRRSSLH